MTIPRIEVINGEFQVTVPEVEPANPNGVDSLHTLIAQGYRLDPHASQWPTGKPREYDLADDQKDSI